MSASTKCHLLETYNHKNIWALWPIYRYTYRGPNLTDHLEEDDAPSRIIASPRPVVGPGASALIHLPCIPTALWECLPSSDPPHRRSSAPDDLGGSHRHLLLPRVSSGMGLTHPASHAPRLHSRRHILEIRRYIPKKNIYK